MFKKVASSLKQQMLMVVAPGKDTAKRWSCLSALFLPLQETKADVSADEDCLGLTGELIQNERDNISICEKVVTIVEMCQTKFDTPPV